MICDRYDVVVIPFPFAETPVLKRRPSVVLSGKSFNDLNQSTLVAMITSSTGPAWPSDVVLKNLIAAGLLVSCRVRWRLTTIPTALIVRRLGKLDAFDRLSCEREFANMIS